MTPEALVPPKKPWENADQSVSVAPPVPVAQSNQQQSFGPYTQPYGSIPDPTYSGGFGYNYGGMGYTGGGYGGYGSYPNRPIFGPSVPLFSTLESGTNSLFDRLRHLVQAITSIAQFLDSTVYAGWSSINALGLAADNFRQLKDLVVVKWVGMIRRFIGMIMGLFKGGARAPIGALPKTTLLLVLTAIPVVISAVSALLSRGPEQVAFVVHEYFSDEEGHLTLSKGDTVKILVKDNGWALGVDGLGRKGLFPLNHVSSP